MINGIPIDYLCEVPLECHVLIVDVFGKCNFWLNVLQFHKISQLSKPKINFLMHYLNSRKMPKEIVLFLNDRSRFNIIKNEIDSVFEKFQGDDGLVDMNKANFFTSKKLKQTILRILDQMENNYFTSLDTQGHYGADKDQMIETHYKKIMDQTIKDIYDQIHEFSNEEFSKVKPNDLETKFFVDENKLRREEKEIIGKKLGFLLKSYETNFRTKLRKENLKNVEKKIKTNKLNGKDYVQENIEKLSLKWDKTLEKIEKRYPSLFQLNIPKIESEYIFTRFELHNYYTKFKALVHMNAFELGSKQYDVDKGIDILTFRKGLSENFASAHEELIKKMFSLNNNNSNTMKWAQYLNILNSVRAKTLQAKLDLFFKLMDNDGNGQLSYSEIKYLCSESLKKLLQSSDEDFIEDLACTFTKFVFEAVELDLNEEIDVEVLKNYMINNTQSEEVDLLLMMSCAEKSQEETSLEELVQKEDAVYLKETEENNLKKKSVYFEKEETHLKKVLIFEPENKKVMRRSSLIHAAKEINQEKEKEKTDEGRKEKKRQEEELMEKLKGKAEEKKKNLIRYGGDVHEVFEETFGNLQMQFLGKSKH